MTFPTRLQDLANDGRLVIRSALKVVTMDGSSYGFWNGSADITVDGLVYWPNSLIEITEPTYQLGTAAATFDIELVATQDSGITPDKLALIEGEEYKNGPASVFDFYFDPDTRAFLYASPGPYGYMDTIDHTRDGSFQRKLVCHVQSGAIANFRDGYRSSSDVDQQLVSPGDKFFNYASIAKHEVFDISF